MLPRKAILASLTVSVMFLGMVSSIDAQGSKSATKKLAQGHLWP
jgi:hypothetical protein